MSLEVYEITRNINLKSCSICLKTTTQDSPGPFLLPCLRSVCAVCKNDAIAINGHCTFCRERMFATRKEDMIGRNHFLASYVRKNLNMILCTRRTDGHEARCFCFNCRQFLCKECYHDHVTSDKSHEMMTMTKMEDLPVGEWAADSKCLQHPDYPLTHCISSDGHYELRCVICKTEKYQNEAAEELDIETACDSEMTKLQMVSERLSKRISILCATINSQCQKDALKRDITDTFDTLEHEIQRKYHELKTINDDISLNSEIKVKLTEGRNYAQKLLKTSKHDFLSVVPAVEKRLKSLLRKVENPVITRTMSARNSHILEQRCERLSSQIKYFGDLTCKSKTPLRHQISAAIRMKKQKGSTTSTNKKTYARTNSHKYPVKVNSSVNTNRLYSRKEHITKSPKRNTIIDNEKNSTINSHRNTDVNIGKDSTKTLKIARKNNVEARKNSTGILNRPSKTSVGTKTNSSAVLQFPRKAGSDSRNIDIKNNSTVLKRPKKSNVDSRKNLTCGTLKSPRKADGNISKVDIKNNSTFSNLPRKPNVDAREDSSAATLKFPKASSDIRKVAIKNSTVLNRPRKSNDDRKHSTEATLKYPRKTDGETKKISSGTLNSSGKVSDDSRMNSTGKTLNCSRSSVDTKKNTTGTKLKYSKQPNSDKRKNSIRTTSNNLRKTGVDTRINSTVLNRNRKTNVNSEVDTRINSTVLNRNRKTNVNTGKKSTVQIEESRSRRNKNKTEPVRHSLSADVLITEEPRRELSGCCNKDSQLNTRTSDQIDKPALSDKQDNTTLKIKEEFDPECDTLQSELEEIKSNFLSPSETCDNEQWVKTKSVEDISPVPSASSLPLTDYSSDSKLQSELEKITKSNFLSPSETYDNEQWIIKAKSVEDISPVSWTSSLPLTNYSDKKAEKDEFMSRLFLPLHQKRMLIPTPEMTSSILDNGTPPENVTTPCDNLATSHDSLTSYDNPLMSADNIISHNDIKRSPDNMTLSDSETPVDNLPSAQVMPSDNFTKPPCNFTSADNVTLSLDNRVTLRDNPTTNDHLTSLHNVASSNKPKTSPDVIMEPDNVKSSHNLPMSSGNVKRSFENMEKSPYNLTASPVNLTSPDKEETVRGRLVKQPAVQTTQESQTQIASTLNETIRPTLSIKTFSQNPNYEAPWLDHSENKDSVGNHASSNREEDNILLCSSELEPDVLTKWPLMVNSKLNSEDKDKDENHILFSEDEDRRNMPVCSYELGSDILPKEALLVGSQHSNKTCAISEHSNGENPVNHLEPESVLLRKVPLQNDDQQSNTSYVIPDHSKTVHFILDDPTLEYNKYYETSNATETHLSEMDSDLDTFIQDENKTYFEVNHSGNSERNKRAKTNTVIRELDTEKDTTTNEDAQTDSCCPLDMDDRGIIRSSENITNNNDKTFYVSESGIEDAIKPSNEVIIRSYYYPLEMDDKGIVYAKEDRNETDELYHITETDAEDANRYNKDKKHVRFCYTTNIDSKGNANARENREDNYNIDGERTVHTHGTHMPIDSTLTPDRDTEDTTNKIMESSIEDKNKYNMEGSKRNSCDSLDADAEGTLHIHEKQMPTDRILTLYKSLERNTKGLTNSKMALGTGDANKHNVKGHQSSSCDSLDIDSKRTEQASIKSAEGETPDMIDINIDTEEENGDTEKNDAQGNNSEPCNEDEVYSSTDDLTSNADKPKTLFGKLSLYVKRIRGKFASKTKSDMKELSEEEKDPLGQAPAPQTLKGPPSDDSKVFCDDNNKTHSGVPLFTYDRKVVAPTKLEALPPRENTESYPQADSQGPSKYAAAKNEVLKHDRNGPSKHAAAKDEVSKPEGNRSSKHAAAKDGVSKPDGNRSSKHAAAKDEVSKPDGNRSSKHAAVKDGVSKPDGNRPKKHAAAMDEVSKPDGNRPSKHAAAKDGVSKKPDGNRPSKHAAAMDEVSKPDGNRPPKHAAAKDGVSKPDGNRPSKHAAAMDEVSKPDGNRPSKHAAAMDEVSKPDRNVIRNVNVSTTSDMEGQSLQPAHTQNAVSKQNNNIIKKEKVSTGKNGKLYSKGNNLQEPSKNVDTKYEDNESTKTDPVGMCLKADEDSSEMAPTKDGVSNNETNVSTENDPTSPNPTFPAPSYLTDKHHIVVMMTLNVVRGTSSDIAKVQIFDLEMTPKSPRLGEIKAKIYSPDGEVTLVAAKAVNEAMVSSLVYCPDVSGVHMLELLFQDKHVSGQLEFTSFEEDMCRDAVVTYCGYSNTTIKCPYLEFDKDVIYKEYRVTDEGLLSNKRHRKRKDDKILKKYRGAISTNPLTSGIQYWELIADVVIKYNLLGKNMLLEAAITSRDYLDDTFKLEGKKSAWGVTLARCKQHDAICIRTWGEGVADKHTTLPLLNKPQEMMDLHLSFLLIPEKSRLVIADIKQSYPPMIIDGVDSDVPLWPAWGIFNDNLADVTLRVVSGDNVTIDRQRASYLYESLADDKPTAPSSTMTDMLHGLKTFGQQLLKPKF